MPTKLSVEDTLRKAKTFVKKGNITEAQKLYHAILSNFPNNDRARQGLANLNIHNKINSNQKQLNQEVNHLVTSLTKGKL